MTPALCAALPAVRCVRARRYRVAQAGFRTQTVTLVTTLLARIMHESRTRPWEALQEVL